MRADASSSRPPRRITATPVLVLAALLAWACGEPVASPEATAPEGPPDVVASADELIAEDATVFIVQYDESATTGSELAAAIMATGAGAGAAASVLATLERSVPTIQGEEAREKYGVSGRGIGVAILDSGIDGLYHQDVRFPERTVQNLKILINHEDVFCLENQPCAGSIYVEDLANSETSVGHGTHV